MSTSVPSITWDRALGWRLRRHFLDPIGDASVEEVVGRLCGVQAQVASSAEMAVRFRQAASKSGDVAEALSDGRIIKTWAMRGTLHLLQPSDAAFLSLIADAKPWARPSWIRYFGTTPEGMERLRDAVREELDGRTLSREELIEGVTGRPGLADVGVRLRSGWGTLLKPIAWQGDLCFGLMRGTRVTFQHPSDTSARWKGIPAPDDAAPVAIAAYLRAYGPATPEAFASWLAGGWFPKRKVKAYFAAMGDRLAEVDMEGSRAFVLTEDLDELLAARPTEAVRLLPGFDQWVLGPGTADTNVLAAARRSAVSRQSGWIAPIVVAGGVIAGTWALDGQHMTIEWFRERGNRPKGPLMKEAKRLGGILGRKMLPASAVV